MSRLALAIASLLLLAGCASKPIGSIEGGECKLTAAPEYAVKGATPYDQRWINRTTEALVVGCKQPRPEPRPASLDAAPPAAAPIAPPPKKRLRDRFLSPFTG